MPKLDYNAIKVSYQLYFKILFGKKKWKNLHGIYISR